jgi:hypothetical protein
MTDINASEQTIAGAAKAGELFDYSIQRAAPFGGFGQSFWFGPVGSDDELRVDIDMEVGRASVTWLPDGRYAVELPADQPLTVQWTVDDAPVEIPAELVRVSTATARRLVTDYVASGNRPAAIDWVANPS